MLAPVWRESLGRGTMYRAPLCLAQNLQSTTYRHSSKSLSFPLWPVNCQLFISLVRLLAVVHVHVLGVDHVARFLLLLAAAAR